MFRNAGSKIFWGTIIICAIGGATLAHTVWTDAFHTLGTLIGHHSIPSIPSIKKTP